MLPLLPKRAASRDFVHSLGDFTLAAVAWGPRVIVDGLRTHWFPPSGPLADLTWACPVMRWLGSRLTLGSLAPHVGLAQ